jgi:hypothetical protein
MYYIFLKKYTTQPLLYCVIQPKLNFLCKPPSIIPVLQITGQSIKIVYFKSWHI